MNDFTRTHLEEVSLELELGEALEVAHAALNGHARLGVQLLMPGQLTAPQEPALAELALVALGLSVAAVDVFVQRVRAQE